MEYPYIIVDENLNNVNTIQLAFENLENFMCVGVASSEQKGLDLILERMPALVFLNIEVQGSQADKTLYFLISELQKYLDVLPQFIVLAKTEQYAIEGIRHGVLDYIVSPLDTASLRRSIFRFKKTLGMPSLSQTTLCFKSYGDYKFINADEVTYLKADNNATDFMMANGNVVGAFKPLKYFENSLPDHFVRIHNSYIVNTNYISRIHFGKSKFTVKNSNSYIPFSKSYRANVEFIKDQLSMKSHVVA